MNFDNHTYDAIGVAIAKELFKQAEDIFPISDEPTPPKPSLFKRLIGLVNHKSQHAERDTELGTCDEEMSAQPSL